VTPCAGGSDGEPGACIKPLQGRSSGSLSEPKARNDDERPEMTVTPRRTARKAVAKRPARKPAEPASIPLLPVRGGDDREGLAERMARNAAEEFNLPIVRTSERRDFKRCQTRWWWSWREGLKATEEAKALWFGTGIHLALEHHYGPGGLKRGKNMVKVWRDYAKDMSMVTMSNGRALQNSEDSPEYVKAYDLGVAMLEGYLDHYGNDEHMHVIAVELPFQMIIPALRGDGDACIYAGKWDILYRDLRYDGEPMTLGDHKTAADLSTKHLTLDDQAGSYWALGTQFMRAKGILGPKESIRTIEYNILRKYLPPVDDRPTNAAGESLNQDGSVSKRQPKPLSYRFHRERVHRTPRERATQINSIAKEVLQMEPLRGDPELLTKNPTRDCSWDCQFFDMCEMQERQSDWEEFKQVAFRVQDPYADHRKVVEA